MKLFVYMSLCMGIECYGQCVCVGECMCRGGGKRITVLAIKLQWLFRRNVCAWFKGQWSGVVPLSVSQSSCPRLPAENTHTCGVDADETPGCPFVEDGEGAYEYVCVGTVGVPVATVDAETA